jgi:hypothetical protein
MKPPEKLSGRSEERNGNALAAYPTERIRRDSPDAQFVPVYAARIKAVCGRPLSTMSTLMNPARLLVAT